MEDLIRLLETIVVQVVAIKPAGMPLALDGLWDEAGHLATVAILLLPFRSLLTRPFVVAAVAMGVLIDLDHIPLYLGLIGTPDGAIRPFTHSLALALLCGLGALLARGSWRLILGGAAFGICAHLVRDMATGGVPLLWPLDQRGYVVSYSLYVAGLLSLLTLSGLQVVLAWLQRTAATPQSEPPAPRDRFPPSKGLSQLR